MKMFKKNHFLYFLILLSTFLTGCSSKLVVEEAKSLELTTARYAHAAVNDGKKIYVLAGSGKTGFLSSIEIVDPVSGHIEVIKDRLISRRYFSAVWDGKHSIYILGGVSLIDNNKINFERRVEVFNTITHEVTFAEQLPAPTRINSAVLLNGKIFVVGGAYPKNGRLKASRIVSVLDIAKNKWGRAPGMPTAKETRAVVKDGLLYVVGGYNEVSPLNVFERFDPKLNQWQSLPPMPTKISAHSITVVKNKLFVFGDYSHLNSTFSYDFETHAWEKIDIGYKASRHNAATTLGDSTYVIGGTKGDIAYHLDYIQTFKL